MSHTATAESEETESGKQLELLEHLTELRTRLVRTAVYVGLGTIVGWVYYKPFFKLLSAPMAPALGKGQSFIGTDVTEGFMIRVQIAVLIGIIIAFPLVTLEAWRFIAPGLTRKERRAAQLIGPLSVILFASGVVLSYFIQPVGIRWLVSQYPAGVSFMPKIGPNVIFILKMYLAFGVVFQMPIVLMFLGKIGIVDSKMLKSYWRQAIVLIGIVAAAITPSGDAFTMLVMAGPMVLLYVLSIGFVRLVEPRS